MSTNAPQIMGVLNITPNSFSDGGDFITPANAIARAKGMIEEGAEIIDIGAESTAPNAEVISETEEWERLSPILPGLSKLDALISLDSYKSITWAKAAAIQPDIIFNDVSGMQKETEEKIKILKKYPKSKVIIMFSRDITLPDPQNIMKEIFSFFSDTISILKKEGIHKERIIIDPGMGGFLSKTPEISFQVIQNLEQMKLFGCNILVGTSRKSFLRTVSHPNNPKKRLISSIITAMHSWKNGASIIRTHDVQETKEAIDCEQLCMTDTSLSF